MKNSKSLITLVAASLLLGACAKTDSEFAEKYRQNAANADVIDGKEAEAAGEAAAEKGIKLDIADITKVSSGGHHKVTATLIVNDKQFTVTTSHYTNASYGSFPMWEGSQNVDGYVVAYHAVCSNVACDPFYAAVEMSKDMQIQIQTGMRKIFDTKNMSFGDRYQYFTPANVRRLIKGSSLTANDLKDPSVMVGHLNSLDKK